MDDPPLDPGEAAAILAQHAEAARAAWPGLALEIEEFVRHMAGRIRGVVTTVDQLRQLCAADLYLARACCRGELEAIAVVDRELAEIARHVARGSEADAHELLQQLRVKLLVGTADEPPRIAAYAGLGSLERWLRVAAMRAHLSADDSPER